MFATALSKNKKSLSLCAEYLELHQRYGVKMWPMFTRLIDPCCYYKFIKCVDSHHFPGIYDEQSSPYKTLEDSIPDILALNACDPESILNWDEPWISKHFDARPIRKNAAHLRKGGYGFVSLAVRQAVYEEILPMVVQFGLDPAIKSVHKDILNDISL